MRVVGTEESDGWGKLGQSTGRGLKCTQKPVEATFCVRGPGKTTVWGPRLGRWGLARRYLLAERESKGVAFMKLEIVYAEMETALARAGAEVLINEVLVAEFAEGEAEVRGGAGREGAIGFVRWAVRSCQRRLLSFAYRCCRLRRQFARWRWWSLLSDASASRTIASLSRPPLRA